MNKLTEVMWEELKHELFANGKSALEDVLGFELHDNYDKDVVGSQLEDKFRQIPDDVATMFYNKYVRKNYVNDDGSIATIVNENGQYKAYVEPDSEVVGPFTGKEILIDELINKGFYVLES